MLWRFLETLLDLFLAFLAFFSSLDEELEADPARTGAATTGTSEPVASVSASLGVASTLFLGAEEVAPASVVGLPE